MSSTSASSAQVAYSVFPARVAGSEAQGQPIRHNARVTIIVQDSTIDYVLHEALRQAGLRSVFVDDAALPAKRISVHLVSMNAMDAIGVVLKGTGLTATLAAEGGPVIIRAHARAATAPRAVANGTITGRVTDSVSGKGLRAASIKIAGTKLSAITSDSGHFTIQDVPPGNQMLTVRLFGYKPAERTVTVVDSQRTTVHITMTTVPTMLSGVVTTATGVQRRIEVGNDITNLNVDSIMRTAPINSVTDLLETRVPGLTVLHSSGVPGDPSRIRLRGIGSGLGNNDPIVIVDGIRVYSSQSDARNNNLAPTTDWGSTSALAVNGGFGAPSPLDQIDPANIETIEVFKGPSATSLYGSDAASGVIVITTKHGHAGPTHWTLGLGQGVNWLPGAWPENQFRFGSGNNNVVTSSPFCTWNDPTCIVDSVVAFQALNDPRYTVFSHGTDQQANATISGGVPVLQYSVSGSVASDIGNLKLPALEKQRVEKFHGTLPTWMVRPDNYQTWGASGSLIAQPISTMQVTLNTSLFNSTQQRSALETAISQLEGTYIDPTQLGITPTISGVSERATDHQLNSNSALNIAWRARPWLPLTATVGINTIQRADAAYVPYGFSTNNDADTSGYFGLGHGTSQNQTLTVGTTISLWQHLMNLSVGGNVYQQSTADLQAVTNQLSPGVEVPTEFPVVCAGFAGTCSSFVQSVTATSTYGWYVEPQFSMASRFFVTPGFRLDGGSGGSHLSTTGGATGGLTAFPKLNLSYVAVDRQSGHPLGGILTLLRPRLAFGYAGVQPQPADRLRLFNKDTVGQTIVNPGGEGTISDQNSTCHRQITMDGTTFIPAVCLNSLGNTQLRPERSSELEGGFDATLWNGRLSLTMTRFNKITHDAMFVIPVAPSVDGFNGQTFSIEKNIGEVRNTGTELTLNATVLQSRAMSWYVGANISNTSNLLVHLNPGQAAIVLQQGLGLETRLTPGFPLFGMWARPIVGFSDINHDGVIEDREVVVGDSVTYVGQPNPKYEMNFTTGLTFLNGRFSINATVSYQNGLTQDNYAALSSGAFAALGNANPALVTQAALTAAGINSTCQACLVNTTDIGLIQTVNTLRFQSLSINYDFPQSIATWFRVPRMSATLQGSNLGLETNYRGKDPGVNAFTTVSSGDETADLGQIPQPRTWWLKFRVGN